MANKVFKENVRRLRTARGMSKSELARQLGVTTTCVWNWEEGNTFPRSEALAKLAQTLGTTTDHLERGSLHDEVAPLKVVASRGETVADVVRRAREEIAAIAGVTADRVKVSIDYAD